ncbi:MAG: MATE family efflux transporter [Flavobacteriales bacterium]|nr:MATE family efflux transporter [Flavobacteriales bacterium]
MSIPIALGTQNVSQLLRQYAIPSIIAMTASSLYNMVDSIFIGQGVGALAISGLAVTFPLMNLAAAFGMLVGVGGSTLISVRLGQKDYKTAERILGNVLLLNVVIGVLFSIFTLAFLDPILYFFGASENTISYARDYMEVILAGNVISHLYLGLNAVLRSSGHPRKSMNATVFTVVLNTILDPIFIFVFDWGIRGVAVATIISQALALLWQAHIFTDKNEILHFHKEIFRVKRKIIADILSIGMSPFLMQLAACFIVILINNSLMAHGGDLAIGAFGIVNRISFLFLMITFGLNQGMQPIAGYNYGARQIKRVESVYRLTVMWASIITTAGFVVAMAMPGAVVSVFTTDEELISLAVYGLRIVMASFPIIGFQIVTTNFFQSIGMVKKSIVLSLTRQVIFLIPALLILPNVWGITGVWISMPVADVLATVMAFFMITAQIRKFKSEDALRTNE